MRNLISISLVVVGVVAAAAVLALQSFQPLSTNLVTSDEAKYVEVDFAFERFVSEHGRNYQT